MDELIEIALDLIIDGGLEISSNKKISKWIRYPIIALISLFFLTVTIGLLVLGILILKQTILGGIFIIIISIILIISSIIKFKNLYLKNKNK